MHEAMMAEAIRLSREGMRAGQGGPFGAVVVRGQTILGRGWNQVLSTHDPTAHAEVVAIREACRTLQSFHLADCELYTSCEPCPMCLAAIYWSRLRRVYYANTRADAAAIGFSDAWLYEELPKPLAERTLPLIPLGRAEAGRVFAEWQAKADRTMY